MGYWEMCSEQSVLHLLDWQTILHKSGDQAPLWLGEIIKQNMFNPRQLKTAALQWERKRETQKASKDLSLSLPVYTQSSEKTPKKLMLLARL